MNGWKSEQQRTRWVTVFRVLAIAAPVLFTAGAIMRWNGL